MDLQQQQRELDSDKRAYEDALMRERSAQDQLNQLHTKRNDLQKSETVRLQQAQAPLKHEHDTATHKIEELRHSQDKLQQDIDTKQRELTKIREKIAVLEAELQKIMTKERTKEVAEQKVVSLEVQRIENDIRRTEALVREWHAKAENARRDVEIRERQIQTAQRDQMNALRQGTSNRIPGSGMHNQPSSLHRYG